MKKILSLLMTVVLSLVLVFSLSACSEIENGSKIQRMNMVLEYEDADGNVVQRTVGIKLYLTYAPETCAHFMQLAASGYYDGLCVYNVKSGWIEFGGYKYENDELVKADGNVSTVAGEFSKNGVNGNKLLSGSAGVLVMKHDRVLDTDKNVSKYDSAKATVMLTTMSSSAFSSAYASTEYCVFGKVIDDDECYEQTDSTSTSVTTTAKTSLDACKALADYAENDEGITVYYYDPDEVDGNSAILPGYYLKYVHEDDDGATLTEYYDGTAIDEDNLLADEDLAEFNELMSKNSYSFYVIPYTRITIKSITKA